MSKSKMEQIKSFLDSGIAFIGILAAFIAVLSWYAGRKVDAEKAIEEEKLRTRVIEANAEAENAKKEAAKANESIAKTDLKAQELEIEIINQKEKANNISLELEMQKEKTAVAEKELLILQDKVKSRTISDTVKNKIIKDLSKFTPRQIKFQSPLGDGEARLFAHDLAGVFECAGWNIDISGISSSVMTGSGLILLNINSNDDRINIICDTFKNNGISIDFFEMEHRNMVLFVGTKHVTI